MIIIGLTGTIGAGKGTVVDYLKQEKNFAHYSARDLLTEEVMKRGLPVNRDSYVSVSNALRLVHGPWFIAEALFTKAVKEGKDAIIESLRTPGEINFLRQNPEFYLLAVDAHIELRYKRIKKRKSETDHVTFEKFIEDEQKEMTSQDPHTQNLKACIDMADGLVFNDGSMEELFASVDAALKNVFAK